MEIQYSPDLPEADQLELKGLYETLYGGTLLFPNSNMDYAVAATTWTNLLGCNEYKGAVTLDAIRDFGKATWGRYGGEPVNGFAISGPSRPRTNRRASPALDRREEASRVAAGGQARIGSRIADDLRSAPRLAAVGEAALELLQPVAGGDAASEVQRQIPLRGEIDESIDDVLHRRLAQVAVRACR